MSAVLENQQKNAPATFIDIKTRSFSIREYDRMIEIGLFDEDERIELLNGKIIEISKKRNKAFFNNIKSK